MRTRDRGRAPQGARREALREPAYAGGKREGTRRAGVGPRQLRWRGGAACPEEIDAQKLLGMSLEGSVG
jgi:hypothetical protein